jgi:hypothetical protein
VISAIRGKAVHAPWYFAPDPKWRLAGDSCLAFSEARRDIWPFNCHCSFTKAATDGTPAEFTTNSM